MVPLREEQTSLYLLLTLGHGSTERRQEDRGGDEDGNQERDLLSRGRWDEKHELREHSARGHREDNVGQVERLTPAFYQNLMREIES